MDKAIIIIKKTNEDQLKLKLQIDIPSQDFDLLREAIIYSGGESVIETKDSITFISNDIVSFSQNIQNFFE